MYRCLRISAAAALLIALLGIRPAPLPAAEEAVTSPNPRELLQQMYRAMGGDAWQALPGLKLSGQYELGGLRGSFQQLVDLHAGRDMLSFDVGSTRGSEGTCLDQSWWTDEKGLPTIDDTPEARADAATESFEDRNGWFNPDPGMPISYAGRRYEKGRAFDLVRLLPPEGRELTLWIDARTHWLDRVWQLDAEQQPFVVTFADYRYVEGVWMAFRQRVSTGDSGNDATMSIQQLRATAPLNLAQFAPPSSDISDARLLGNAVSTTIPFTLRDGIIIVNVSIEGATPMPFALDSGALNLMTPAAAERLNSQLTGNLTVGGVGSELTTSHLTHVRHYQIGQAQLDDQQFIVMPLPTMLTGHGKLTPVAGLIGYELLRRFRVTIDYTQQRLTLAPPSAAPAGEQLPLYFDGRRPFVKASVDGVEGYFGVDTGDDGALTLFTRFFTTHAFPIEFPGIDTHQGGVGGVTPTLLTRIDALSFGDLTLSRPLTELNFAHVGAFAADRVAGNLGALVWQNFVVTLDYPHHALYLRKAADFGRPMPYDRSGMHVDLDARGRVFVTGLEPASPAALAGVRVGDELTAIARDAVADDFATVKKQLTQPAGTPVQLSLRRGWQRLQVRLILKELLPVDLPLQPGPPRTSVHKSGLPKAPLSAF